jgi:hypothetical protein
MGEWGVWGKLEVWDEGNVGPAQERDTNHRACKMLEAASVGVLLDGTGRHQVLDVKRRLTHLLV